MAAAGEEGAPFGPHILETYYHDGLVIELCIDQQVLEMAKVSDRQEMAISVYARVYKESA
jgi:hypothetical protein